MHTEHLQNVRATRVAAGWLVAIAVTSLAVFVAVGFQLVDAAAQFGTTWSLAAVMVGFFAGGFFAGREAGVDVHAFGEEPAAALAGLENL